jgi:hypothetical protein
MIEIAKAKAYISIPAGAKAPMPAVIVVHEWWGLNDNVMFWTDRIAAEGYSVLVPNPFYRVAKAPVIQDDYLAEIKPNNAGFIGDADKVLRRDLVALLPSAGPRVSFVIAGLAVEHAVATATRLALTNPIQILLSPNPRVMFAWFDMVFPSFSF